MIYDSEESKSTGVMNQLTAEKSNPPADFIKALCLGTDGIALSSAAMQAIGCVAARICRSDNCPTGIATSTSLLQVMTRACGHDHLNQFTHNDITTWKYVLADL